MIIVFISFSALMRDSWLLVHQNAIITFPYVISQRALNFSTPVEFSLDHVIVSPVAYEWKLCLFWAKAVDKWVWFIHPSPSFSQLDAGISSEALGVAELQKRGLGSWVSTERKSTYWPGKLSWKWGTNFSWVRPLRIYVIAISITLTYSLFKWELSWAARFSK